MDEVEQYFIYLFMPFSKTPTDKPN